MCHTLSGTGSWLQIDLGATHTIAQVTIYNRQDCCQYRLAHHQIWLSDSSTTPATKCFDGTAGNSAGPFKEECIGTGRYVRIVLPGNSRMLNLAEVKVFTTIRCLATTSPTAAPSKAVTLRPLAALFLFNQAFDFSAVITSDSRQVSQSFYFTYVPQTLQMSQCCFTQTHTHITAL
jgi:hypothetical protein